MSDMMRHRAIEFPEEHPTRIANAGILARLSLRLCRWPSALADFIAQEHHCLPPAVRGEWHAIATITPPPASMRGYYHCPECGQCWHNSETSEHTAI